MEKVQRLNGDGVEDMSKSDDTLRYSLVPVEKRPYLSIIYLIRWYIMRTYGAMISVGND